MTSENARTQLVDAVTGTEEAIARLYEAYANVQPEHEEFWFGLMIQEADHANLVHSFINHTFQHPAGFLPDPYIAQEIVEFRQYLETEMDKLDETVPSFTDAIRVALNIERSIARERLYSVFSGPSDEAKRILKLIREENQGHIQYLNKELHRYLSKDE